MEQQTELVIEWKLSAGGYSAKFNSQQEEYVLEVTQIEQGEWTAKVNDEVITDQTSSAETKFSSGQEAQKAAAKFALDRMMQDGLIR